MRRNPTVSLLAASLLLLVPGLASADNFRNRFRAKPPAEYTQLIKRINAARASDDGSNLVELARLIQNKWVDADIVQYSTLMDKICFAILFSSLGHQDEGPSVVDRFALRALARKQEMPVETEADLVGYIQPQEYKLLLKNTLSNKEWAIYRKARAEISLHLLGHINAETDLHFDFSRLPTTEAEPPLEAAVDSGTSPEAVADPKLRAEYEASIKANEAITDKFNEQYQLKDLNETLVPFQQKYIIDLYSAKPYNLPELKTLLSKYPLATPAKQKIIDQVTANIALNNHP